MENTLEKVFINRHLGIKFNSYIDEKLRVWFKAKEVAKILGYRDTTQAIRKNVSIEDKYKGGVQTTVAKRKLSFSIYLNTKLIMV